MMTLLQIKERLRAGKYAWPGGYPLFFIAADGEALSFEAVRKEFREIVRAHIDQAKGCPDKSWLIDACDINWELPDLFCAHTNERIESAYAEDEARTK